MKEGFEAAGAAGAAGGVQGVSENPWKFNMYYVDWCPHCHHAKPEFEKLGSTMTIGGHAVNLKAIEAEKNPEAVQGLKISGYPTFVLYDAEGNLVKEYDGPRKTDDFRSFLEDTANMKAQRM
jgi:thiol-disulfide isomerase/thioredoxin